MGVRSVIGAAMLAPVVCLLAGCSRPAPLDRDRLVADFTATTAKWNEGDLEGFIAPYSAVTTFMTPQGPIGRDAMRTRYASKYFGPGQSRQRLHFESITVRPLGDDHALMTGRFVLESDAPAQTGWFTLVWVREGDTWRILHDHSS